MPKFINLTPHAITVRVYDPTPGSDLFTETTYPPHGKVARVEMTERVTQVVLDGVPVIVRSPGAVVLPEGLAIDGSTYLIVSSMVLEAAERCGFPMLAYLIAPDTGDTAIRNEKGHIVAVTRWVEANIRRV